MKNKQMRNSRISKLGKGNVKGVGFFEGILLKITGRIDGTEISPVNVVMGIGSLPISTGRFVLMTNFPVKCGDSFRLRKKMSTHASVR